MQNHAADTRYQCCSPTTTNDHGWGIFNAILGWQNSATYGSVISYNLYWLCVIVAFILMRYKEVHGRYPFMKAKPASVTTSPVEVQPEVSNDKGVASTVNPV